MFPRFLHYYREIQRYEQEILTEEIGLLDYDGFVEFVFDNADVNIHTLDDHNTFHNMWGIACVTPSKDKPPLILPYKLALSSADVIGSFGKIPSMPYTMLTSPDSPAN